MRVVARHVAATYGRHSVLTDASFVVEPGTTAAVMGPSGSGKSTLLAIVGGLQTPTSGTIERQVEPGESARVAWVFQASNALPHRTVRDNVALGGFAVGDHRSVCLGKAEALLSTVGLDGYGRRRACELSGGELQRVVIARALIGQPALLLADEPTGQLDRANTRVVLDALLAARTAATVLIVATHDQEVAARCDAIFRIADGRLVPDG